MRIKKIWNPGILVCKNYDVWHSYFFVFQNYTKQRRYYESRWDKWVGGEVFELISVATHCYLNMFMFKYVFFQVDA